VNPNLRKNLLLAAGSVAFTAVVLVIGFEIWANIQYSKWKSLYQDKGDLYGQMTVASDDPKLIWEYKPYGEYEPYGIKVNRWGFRERDLETKAKPEGTYRVAFVGDSVTLGLWTGEPYIFTRQFETIANELAPAKPVQALNFSVDGYDVRHVAELVRARVLDYQPDKVVYALHLNDFDFDGSSGDKMLYFQKPTSFLWARIQSAYDNIVRDRQTTEYHKFHFEKRRDEVFAEIIQLRNFLAGKGIAFSIVVMPVFKDWPSYPLSSVHTEITRFLQSQGIGGADMAGEFLKEGKEIRFFSHDVWHPNHLGHRLIAERMIEPILRNALDHRPMPYAGNAGRQIPTADLYLDYAGLPEVALSETQRIRHDDAQIEERARLDGAKGFVASSYLIGGTYNAQVSNRLKEDTAFKERLQSAFRQVKGQAQLQSIEAVKGEDRFGYYALYRVTGGPAESPTNNCFFGLVGYSFGAFAKKDGLLDSYTLINYCAAVLPLFALRDALEKAKVAPGPLAKAQEP
jgi:hypothetical protein